MKVFKAEHDGKFIFGISVIVASSKAKAKSMMKAKLEEWKKELPKGDAEYFDTTKIDISEIDMLTPGVHVLFDGAY